MKYEKPGLVARASAVDSIQQQTQQPKKLHPFYPDLSQNRQVTSSITTAAAYEADE